MKTIILVPSYRRPAYAERLVIQGFERMTGNTKFIVGVNEDDPGIRQYESFCDARGVELLILEKSSRSGMVEPLNQMAEYAQDNCDVLGFIGDDVIPRTHGWDTRLAAPLTDRVGLSYGNDLIHGRGLPTAVLMSAEIPRKLGYMAPALLHHLYVDNSWKAWGEGIERLHYDHSVVLEHMHPLVGKAQEDETYANQNFGLDGRAWENYKTNILPMDIEMLKELL